MFKVGEKVVCVDAKPNQKASQFYSEWLVEGKEYTVRRCEGSLVGQVRVLLEEVKNDPVFVAELQGKVEPGFAAYRFKSVEAMYEKEEEVEFSVNYN
jgi:hypothetical protein